MRIAIRWSDKKNLETCLENLQSKLLVMPRSEMPVSHEIAGTRVWYENEGYYVPDEKQHTSECTSSTA